MRGRLLWYGDEHDPGLHRSAGQKPLPLRCPDLDAAVGALDLTINAGVPVPVPHVEQLVAAWTREQPQASGRVDEGGDRCKREHARCGVRFEEAREEDGRDESNEADRCRTTPPTHTFPSDEVDVGRSCKRVAPQVAAHGPSVDGRQTDDRAGPR